MAWKPTKLGGSMANSNYARQVIRLRNFLVISQTCLSWISFAAAFYLATKGLTGTPWFLCAGISLSVWSSVTATCYKVSAGDFLGIAKVIGIKGLEEKKNAA